MTSDSHCEECYSNDFEIIDEPNGSEINERNGGVLLSCSSHTMASVDQTVTNAPTVSRNRKMVILLNQLIQYMLNLIR